MEDGCHLPDGPEVAVPAGVILGQRASELTQALALAQTVDLRQMWAVVPFGLVSEGWQRAVGSAARPGELCKLCFCWAMVKVLEAKRDMSDPERLYPCA